MAHRPSAQTMTQLGKQPPLYRFFFHPYQDMRFTRCPECDNKTHQRKLPLVIQRDPKQLLSLNKTYRYCPHGDLLIAHQDDVEHILASFFAEEEPEIVSNDDLIVGTMERTIWKRGAQQLLTLQEVLDALHDFKEIVTFKVTGGGWVPPNT